MCPKSSLNELDVLRFLILRNSSVKIARNRSIVDHDWTTKLVMHQKLPPLIAVEIHSKQRVILVDWKIAVIRRSIVGTTICAAYKSKREICVRIQIQIRHKQEFKRDEMTSSLAETQQQLQARVQLFHENTISSKSTTYRNSYTNASVATTPVPPPEQGFPSLFVQRFSPSRWHPFMARFSWNSSPISAEAMRRRWATPGFPRTIVVCTICTEH